MIRLRFRIGGRLHGSHEVPFQKLPGAKAVWVLTCYTLALEGRLLYCRFQSQKPYWQNTLKDFMSGDDELHRKANPSYNRKSPKLSPVSFSKQWFPVTSQPFYQQALFQRNNSLQSIRKQVGSNLEMQSNAWRLSEQQNSTGRMGPSCNWKSKVWKSQVNTPSWGCLHHWAFCCRPA